MLSEPYFVKFLITILFSDSEKLRIAINELENSFGEIDFQSEYFIFDSSDYYQEEMGGEIKRVFLSFLQLKPPDILVEAKKKSTEIEQKLAVEGKRKVNIDPGYMDYSKLVLATHKGGGCKIYLKDGVWADLIMRYEKGRFLPFPWTFPDFASGRYSEVLLRIRSIYKNQKRQR